MTATVVWKMARIGQRLTSAKEESGVRGVAGEALQLTRQMSAVPAALAKEWMFDARRGIHTRGFLRNEQQLTALSVGGDPGYYQPMDLRLLPRIVATLPVDPGTTTFVDLGAGRGRGVILAAELGFRRVIGVELDERLVQQADENVRLSSARRGPTASADQQIEVVQGDAATYRLPDGPLFVCLFNPFGGTTLRLLLTALCETPRASTDPVFVAYINPVHTDVFADFPSLPLHAHGPGWSAHRLEPAARAHVTR